MKSLNEDLLGKGLSLQKHKTELILVKGKLAVVSKKVAPFENCLKTSQLKSDKLKEQGVKLEKAEDEIVTFEARVASDTKLLEKCAKSALQLRVNKLTK